MRPIKNLSQDEIKKIKAMYASSYSVSQIAKKFNRHPATIHRLIGKIDERPKIELDFKENVINTIMLIRQLEEIKQSIDKILESIKPKNV